MKHCKNINCDFKYIGESGTTMKQRDILHQSDIKTKKTRCALYTHIEENKGHTIDWERKTILDKDKDFEKRKLKEALYICAFDKDSLMNPDKRIPTNSIWTEFFPQIKKHSKF